MRREPKNSQDKNQAHNITLTLECDQEAIWFPNHEKFNSGLLLLNLDKDPHDQNTHFLTLGLHDENEMHAS